jgi:hypothetical protein
VTTREARRAELIRAQHEAVRGVLRTTVHGLAEEEITDLLAQSRAGSGLPLRELAEHLTIHPDALISGQAGGPSVLFRVLQHLADSGYPVVLPRCTGCQKVTTKLSRRGPTGRICIACDASNRRGDCARCGRTQVRIGARRPEGPICYPCYRRDPQRVEACGRCGRSCNPITRQEDGTALCQTCWTPPRHVCVHCGRLSKAHSVGEEGPVCGACYFHYRRPRRLCGRCGHLRPISKRATTDEPDLCVNCYRGPEMTCTICGQVDSGHRNSDSEWVCRVCTPRIPQSCAGCGQSRPVHARLPLGPVCSSCHTRIHDSPRHCGICGDHRVLIGRDEEGRPICGPCSGSALDPRCRNCRRPGRHFTHGKCAHCILEERLLDTLAGPDGTVSAQLQPVLRFLSDGRSPAGLISWLRDSAKAQLLHELAKSGQTITHELLDAAPQGRHEYFLRQLLVQAGALPPRRDDLDRIPAWLDNILADKPDTHARLVRPFAHWGVLRRARQRARTRAHHATAGNHLRVRITVALEFLSWLDGEALTLEMLDQTALERWLAEGNTRAQRIRYFLSWAQARGLVQDLVLPSLRRTQPGEMLDEVTRWHLLQRCLHDNTLPPNMRAAAALLLLFGLTITRIRHLTADQLEQQDGHTVLRTGKHPLLLPPKLAELLIYLSTTHRGRSRYQPDPATPRWLFPGMTPGQPMTHNGFAPTLKHLGINARTARNAALIGLASELPPAVLADLLDMHPTTAGRWADLARRDWQAYIATRTTEYRRP